MTWKREKSISMNKATSKSSDLGESVALIQLQSGS